MRLEGDHSNTKPLGYFETTHWSVVLAAGVTESPQAQSALEKLCLSYWYPLYASVRRRGYSPEDARDLTQEFFARLLENNLLRHADRDRGRFRTFLQTCLGNFLQKEWVKSQATKRGGGQLHLSLDAAAAEERFTSEPHDSLTPETLFERRWAAVVLENTIARLADEYAAANKTILFVQLKAYLWGDGIGNSYAAIGRETGMSEGAVKVAAHRLRERYRELLRAEVARTVSSPDQTEDELRHLLKLISH